MERSRKLLLVGGILLIFALLFGACLPSASTPPPSEISGGTPATAATPSGGETGTGGEAPTAGTGNGSSSSEQIPEDLPIPDGAYEEDINTSVGQISFRVAGDAESTMAYYQDALSQAGWEMAGAQDTAVGNTALMLRTNAQGDRLSLNMQYNPNGDFTVVTMFVNRAP